MVRAGQQRSLLVAFLAIALVAPSSLWAADPKPGPPLTIRKAPGPITVDGDLSDAGWQGADSITTWFETRVGDNVEPQAGNLAYLTYDDRFFYAGFVFDDPKGPSAIRAPLGDHDAVSSATDYGGVIVDSRNDGKSAQMFLANSRGVQYDALTNDATGETDAPDFFWDAVGKITPTGWNLEIRIPFSSLRYGNQPDQTWGILLYRNYPRDRRYQFFSARLPRDVNCFICNSSKLTGLSSLPRGSHLVVAPVATAGQTSSPEAGLGSSLKSEDVDAEAGVDVKWSPTANTAIDATVNPDFSQVESDAAQIVANERFALFFAEKRPFFLEGADLLSTPFQAVYTRTVTAPRAGVRATGRLGANSYTAFYAQDRGDGLVILPGPEGSDAALQDFVSDVGVVRVRRDMGQSFVSLLATTREIHGGGSNRLIGPDFQWRPKPNENITGQFLWTETETPDRTDLTSQWDGRHLSGGAGLIYWSHGSPREDFFVQLMDIGDDFRADNGFIPQVGYREAYGEAGYTIRPKDKFLNRIRLFTVNWVDIDHDDNVLYHRASVGSGFDGGLNSFTRVELNRDRIRVGTETFTRFRPRFYVESVPGRILNFVSLDALVGDEIDFANARKGSGVSLIGSLSVRPNDHLELRGDASRRWLEVDDPALGSGRLFPAQVERLRATWSFNSRSFLRIIGQYVETRLDTTLYTFAVPEKDAGLSGSALFAYKLNWQTVFYAGYGDERTFAGTTGDLEPSLRQWFTKISYAWQQ